MKIDIDCLCPYSIIIFITDKETTMSMESDKKLYAAIAQLEEMVMEKALVEAQIAVLKMKSERLQIDIDDFEADHLLDYELPDYADIFVALKNLSK